MGVWQAGVHDTMVLAKEARSLVQENAALISKNYTSSFMGNRQLANQNTEDLYRNRLAILRALVAGVSPPIRQRPRGCTKLHLRGTRRCSRE